MLEHLDCGSELNFAIDGTGAYVLVCQKCHAAWVGSLHSLNPALMKVRTNPALMVEKVQAKHPDWFE